MLLPFSTWASFTLIITALYCVGIIPPIGQMRQACKRVRDTGKVFSEKSVEFNSGNVEPESGGHWIDFLLPIVCLIGVTLWSDDLFIAVIVTLVFCAVLYLPRRLMTFNEFCELYMKGLVEIVSVLVLVFAAFVAQNACLEIGLSEYVVKLTAPFLNGVVLPAVTFLIVAMLIFCWLWQRFCLAVYLEAMPASILMRQF